MKFTFNSFLNPNLPVGGARVDVLFSVTAEGGGQSTPSARKVIGLIGDNSGSMGEHNKIGEMKNAMRVAVDQLGPDDEFFVVTFDNRADLVVPLCRADADGKRRAHALIQRIEANGGTAISTGLSLARGEFSKRKGAVCQAVLLTDGQNDGADQSDLERELSMGAGLYQAHCRGVGQGWSPKQLRLVADRLVGTLANIADPSRLADDFRDTLASAMSKSLSDVRLRLWTPKAAEIKGFKQAFPTEIDMFDKLHAVDQRTVEFKLGAWGEGQQDYLATFAVTPNNPGSTGTLLCRPSIAFTDPATGQEVSIEGEKVLIWWSDDASLTSRINAQVAHYTGQAEKAAAIQEGIEALQQGRVDVATVRLGRAAQLANESGDEGTMRLLRQVVDVQDAATATVRVKRDVGKSAMMDLDVASTRTVRANRASA